MIIRILLLQLFVFLDIHGITQNQEIIPKNLNSTNISKLYLHTDREFYFGGDTIWFAAYYLEGKSDTFKNESCNLYTEIINQKGNIILTQLFILKNGSCSGYVPLSDTIFKKGNYLLRVYTDYLKNYSNDAFFTKTIRISEVKNSFELMTEELPPVYAGDSSKLPASNVLLGKGDSGSRRSDLSDKGETGGKLDVSFLPEGGFLLADESNCVAFKAIDKNGFGKNISGRLLDENGDLVLTFNSIYKGAGKFYFYPKPGEKYTVRIDGSPELEFPLTEIRETGAKLKLVNQEDERIQMVIQAKNVKYPLQLVCLHRGKILSELEIDKKKANAFLRLSTQKLGPGINRFVLLDKNSNPLSERLVFQNDKSVFQFEIRLGEENYSTREEVQLNINPAI